MPLVLKDIASVAVMITQIATCAVLLIKPLREWVMGMEDVREGQRCLLRSQIVRTYYRNVDGQELKQFEYENLVSCYKAYKSLGGNSFIDHIYDEMEKWTIH
jgi:hypothetical protein